MIVPSADHASGTVQPLISLIGVTKSFQNGDLTTEVLHGISLDIYAGEFIAIIGASGSGKSTLMNILGCLDRPSGGTYRFAGKDVSLLDADRRAGLRRSAFGFIFQSYNLIATADAAENVAVPAFYAGMMARPRSDRANALLHNLGLGDRLHHRPSQLSGGQQQRVSIARALMNNAQVILADEPTGALDSRSGADVLALLKGIAGEGRTVIMITHDRNIAAAADRTIELRDGMVSADTGSHPQISRDIQWPDLTKDSLGLRHLADAVRLAVRSLRANIFRTALTLLGISIGVGSVVAMLAIGSGASQSILSRIDAMGTNQIIIRPSAPNNRGKDVVSLVVADADAIALLPNVAAVIPEIQQSVTVRYGAIDYSTTADGTTENYASVKNWPIASGSFVSVEDSRTYATSTVLGATVAKALFPDGDNPLGKYILVNRIPFQVVGVMEAKGATSFGQDQDDIVFVPLSSGSLRLFGIKYLRSISVIVKDTTQIDGTQQLITQELEKRHGKIDVHVTNMTSLLETASAMTTTLTLLLASIAGISLLVGGIGVMNIMLVSVTERTREIGVRMATGARTGDILTQFLTEAIVVSAVGGVLGVIIGIGAALALTLAGVTVNFAPMPILLAFSSTFLTGLLFGYLPARKAAHLDPAVALQAE